MKNIKIMILLVATIVISYYAYDISNKPIRFNGLSFVLPMSIDVANKKFKLDDFSRHGEINNRKVLAHTKSDNAVVGITFYKRCSTFEKLKKLRNNYLKNFEKQYRSRFKSIKFSFFTSVDGKYYYYKDGNDLIIVVGDVMYNASDNNYVTISFFRGISIDKITQRLNAIY